MENESYIECPILGSAVGITYSKDRKIESTDCNAVFDGNRCCLKKKGLCEILGQIPISKLTFREKKDILIKMKEYELFIEEVRYTYGKTIGRAARNELFKEYAAGNSFWQGIDEMEILARAEEPYKDAINRAIEERCSQIIGATA